MWILIFLVQMVFAETTEIFDVGPTDRLDVNCLNGRLQFVEDPHAQMKITARMIKGKTENFSSPEIKMEKQDGTINIRCTVPASDLEKLSKKELIDDGNLQWFDVVIRGPSIPTEVTWKWGEIVAKNLKKPTHLVLEHGQIQLKDSTADLRLNVIDGAISVINSKGRLNVETYDARVTIENSEGAVQVRNFLGVTKVTKSNGDLRFVSRKGQINVQDGEGSVFFENGLGHTEISKFKGSIEGSTDQGVFDGHPLDPVQMHLKTKTGQLDIVAPKTSGARVNILIGDGQFHVPQQLKTEYLSQLRSIRGELSGREKGLISVRSDSGKVFLRQN